MVDQLIRWNLADRLRAMAKKNAGKHKTGTTTLLAAAESLEWDMYNPEVGTPGLDEFAKIWNRNFLRKVNRDVE